MRLFRPGCRRLCSPPRITVLLYVFGANTISVPLRAAGSDSSALWLALDGSGRASLSNLQIIFFSGNRALSRPYILLRTEILASLWGDRFCCCWVSLLLAPSGVVSDYDTQRLSFDNWAWAKGKGWTTPAGDHVGQPAMERVLHHKR